MLSFPLPSLDFFKTDVSRGDFQKLVLAGLSAINGGGGGGTSAPSSPSNPETQVLPISVTSPENIDVVVLLTAAPGKRGSIAGLTTFSYSAAPTGGRLTVKDGATTLFDVDITAAGPGPLPLVYTGSVNTALTVTLAAGGSGVIGKLNTSRTWKE